MSSIDIIDLARQALALGYDSPERVVARLEVIIGRNGRYISRPYRSGRAFNEIVEEDMKALALAVVLIESMECGAGGEGIEEAGDQ